MKFYRLTVPDYPTDQAYKNANPICMMGDFYVPGILCSVCAEETGGCWASSGRIRVDIPQESHLRQNLTGRTLPVDEWRIFAKQLREELVIPSWIPITPGAHIGLPQGELSCSHVMDFLHPFPGQIIVREEVIDVLQQSQLTGFQPIPVKVTGSTEITHELSEVPHLYELLIMGKGWRVDIYEDNIVACDTCKRTIFPEREHTIIDDQRWDNTDFFTIDLNPNIVIVTERVYQVLKQANFSNYQCVPLLERYSHS